MLYYRVYLEIIISSTFRTKIKLSRQNSQISIILLIVGDRNSNFESSLEDNHYNTKKQHNSILLITTNKIRNKKQQKAVRIIFFPKIKLDY